MTTVINFNEASIDIELFEAYQKKAMEALEQADTLTKAAKEHKLDFKDYVESIAKATNLPKKDIDAFWKARRTRTKRRVRSPSSTVANYSLR